MAKALLNKLQIRQLISTPSLIARWFVFLLSLVLFLLSAAGLLLGIPDFFVSSFFLTLPPFVMSIYLAALAWKPSSKLRMIGEICSAVILALFVPLTILLVAGGPGEGFNFGAGAIFLLGIAGSIFGATLLCLVEIACLGIPRHVRMMDWISRKIGWKRSVDSSSPAHSVEAAEKLESTRRPLRP